MKSIYESGLHHPLVAWVACALVLVAVVRRLPFLYGYLITFAVVLLADALCTGAYSPVPPGTPAYTGFSLLFVLLGDFRYFLLGEWLGKGDESTSRVVLRAAVTTLPVPLVTGLGMQLVPAMQAPRVFYLVYEMLACSFVVFVHVYRYAPRAAANGDAARLGILRDATALFALLYAGWALADLVLLSERPVGHLVRIVPNVLYYGAFLLVVAFSASRHGYLPVLGASRTQEAP